MPPETWGTSAARSVIANVSRALVAIARLKDVFAMGQLASCGRPVPRTTAGLISVVWVAPVEVVVDGEEDGLALAPVEQARSCVVASLRGFDAILGASWDHPVLNSTAPAAPYRRPRHRETRTARIRPARVGDFKPIPVRRWELGVRSRFTVWPMKRHEFPQVSEQLGHAKMTTTLLFYGHWFPKGDRLCIGQMEHARAAAAPLRPMTMQVASWTRMGPSAPVHDTSLAR
jgi:hypothetical protein